jgi:hypothetical protein
MGKPGDHTGATQDIARDPADMTRLMVRRLARASEILHGAEGAHHLLPLWRYKRVVKTSDLPLGASSNQD